MDLDTAPIRDIKAIMIKLIIDSTGCIDRGDLKRKLIANVPELRMKVEGEGPPHMSKGSLYCRMSIGVNAVYAKYATEVQCQ